MNIIDSFEIVDTQIGAAGRNSYSGVASRNSDKTVMQRPVTRQPLKEMRGPQPGDIALTCVKCTKDFDFTVEQQDYHRANGYDNQPNKCDVCRDKQRVCKLLLETGECRFGSDCKYSHDSSLLNNDQSAAPSQAPGSRSTKCVKFTDGECRKGDHCPYTHEGREREQNAAAVAMEKNEAENVPAQGLTGLKKRM